MPGRVQFEAECQTLRSSLNTVESQCQAAQSEVAELKEKMAGLDHVLRVSLSWRDGPGPAEG